MAAACEISIRSFGLGSKTVKVVYVHGFIDLPTYSQLGKTLDSLISEGDFNLILDLKKLEYISSAGFSLILATARKVREKGGDLRLANLSAKIRRIADLLGCSSIIKVFDDLKEALVSFKS